MQVDPLAQVSNVLRTFVRHAGNVILVDKKHGGVMAVVWSQLLYIDDCAIGDATDTIKPGATFALKIVRTFGFTAQKRIGAESKGAAYNYQ